MKIEIYEAIIFAIDQAYKQSSQEFHNKIFAEGQLTTLETIIRLDNTLSAKDKTFLLEIILVITPKY